MSGPLACPACGSAMVTEPQAGVILDRCAVCGMIWCDRTELAAVVTEQLPGTTMNWGTPVAAASPQGWLTCPRDGTPSLRPFALGEVAFRRCSSCQGVAIAAEDLQRLLLQGPDREDQALREGLRRLASE